MKHVAVVGGGFSGTMQAVNLLRAGARVTLIERARLARGAAYRTRHAAHLLNVAAAGMSAFPAEPNHFAEWLAFEGAGDGDSFAPRRVYGRYLDHLLAEARVAAGERLNLVKADATDVVGGDGGEEVVLRDGRTVAADAVILAIGNLPPAAPPAIAAAGLAPGIYVADPWAGDLAAGLRPEDDVLLIGAGLTAIDAALMLDAAGFDGRILALSRRGLVPRSHASPASPPAMSATPRALPTPDCRALLRSVREDARTHHWRGAVDRLRPVTQPLWASASLAQRRRFLRHLRPYWDVHRHRLAPAVAAKVEAMERAGKLAFRAGKLMGVQTSGDTAELRWRPRGSDAAAQLQVRRIVNCTGPQGDIARADEPLLANLLASGRIRADVCRLGIDVDAALRTLGADGSPSRSLYAVGPMTRGAFWEIVAVPEIRVQVDMLARRLV